MPGPTVEAVGRWVTVAPVVDPVVPVSSPAEHDELLCLATLLWLTGCACAVGLRLRRRSALVRLLATARPLTAGPALEALARLRRRSRSFPEVRLLACPDGAHLGIAGLVHPVLLVPDALTRLLEPAEMEALLEHELAHLRRRDPLVEALQAALACALWFFPVVWLLGRRLAVERERACDEEVLQRVGSAETYLAALLKACRAALAVPVPGMVRATSDLRERVAGLLRPVHPRGAGQHAAWVLVTAAGVTLAGAGMQGAIPAERFRWRPVEIVASDAPVRATAARARIVQAGDQEIVHPPEIQLENRSGRAVTGIRLSFGAEPAWRDVVDLSVSVPPRGTAVMEPDWRTWHNTQPAGSPAPLRARIEGVTFRGEPAPEDDAAPRPNGPGFPVHFTNLSGAPLIVMSANAWRAAGEETQVEVALRNQSSRTIVLAKLRFKSDDPGHAVTAQPVTLPPGGALVFRSHPIVPGTPEHATVQVVGVAFQDGGHWGLLDSSIDSRTPHVTLPEETP